MSTKVISKLIREREITAIVFDFDGTLYPSSAGVEQQLKPLMVKTAARALNVSHDEARNTLREYRAQYKSSVLGLHKHHDIDPEGFMAEVYDALDLAGMTIRPGLRAELERLREIVPLVVFTNSNKSFTHRAIVRLDLVDIFETVFTVEDNDFIRKPEPEAYAGFFQHIGHAPERVAMFDDIASSLKILSSFESKTILVGNGLRAEPSFVDLHTGEEHPCAPEFVHASTHSIVDFLKEVNDDLQR